MKVRVLEEKWREYLQKVIPPGASRIQVQETRKAFYSGAGMLLEALTSILGPGREATESDVHMVDDIAEEIREFVREMGGPNPKGGR